jgi:hypothetical protein
MKKINENVIIKKLTLLEQKLVKDVILKKNVFEMCGNIFVLIKDHLAKKVYFQGKLEECPHILACVLKILFGENWKREVGILEITI